MNWSHLVPSLCSQEGLSKRVTSLWCHGEACQGPTATFTNLLLLV